MVKVDRLPIQSLKPITSALRVRAPLCKQQKRVHSTCKPYVIRFVSYLPKVGRFTPGTPAYSSTKTDRHDIAEILLKVA